MDTLAEMRSAIQFDLTLTDQSSFLSPASIDLAINRAYIKAGALFKWPETEDAKTTSTQQGIEYYDYPSNWRAQSAWKLSVDGEDYGDPLVFKDYLYEKENDIPSGADTLWSTQQRRFFIYPIPTSAGTNNITIWGIKTVDKLEEDDDVTIFSYSMPECNEAIVLEADAILKSKGDNEQAGMFRSAEAKQLLGIAWQKIRADRARNEKTTPFFDVPDFFGKSNSKFIIGRF